MTNDDETQRDEAVRVAVYGHFIRTGGTPDSAMIAARLGLSATQLAASYQRRKA